jgi:DNA repair exonuclease SbcCD ATPase subunit
MMGLEEVKEALEMMKQKYSQDMGVVQKLEEDKKAKEAEIQSLYKEKELLEIQKVLLQDASVEARKNAKDVLQSMCTRALQFIIGDYMSLEIKLDEKGNAPVAEFIVKSKYDSYAVETDPAEEEGGGIADIVSFASFIAMLQLAGKNNVAPLFLDEPSKYVSKGHSENVAKFLYEVSAYFGRQVFMVTHDEFLAKMGDKAYHFKIQDGKTVVTAV